jgi:hypothetical protein
MLPEPRQPGDEVCVEASLADKRGAVAQPLEGRQAGAVQEPASAHATAPYWLGGFGYKRLVCCIRRHNNEPRPLPIPFWDFLAFSYTIKTGVLKYSIY